MLRNLFFVAMIIMLNSYWFNVQATEGADSSYWQNIGEVTEVAGERWIQPNQFATFSLNESKLKDLLETAPKEFSEGYKNQLVLVKIPMPNGELQTFKVFESPIMMPDLANRYPQIKTWAGKGVEDPTAIIRFDLTPKGFHGMILRVGSPVFIDPMTNENTGIYQVYYKKDFTTDKAFICEVEAALEEEVEPAALPAPIGDELRIYRLAMATTVEYTNFHGGTVVDGMAAVVTSVNRIVGIYRKEVAISLTLIDDNDQIIYTGSVNSDPYTNNNAVSIVNENQSNLNNVIGVANFDIGHVFTTASGGFAFTPGTCFSGQKGRGTTGTSNPVGDPFDVDFVAHEIGHQFSGLHTFNGTQGNCAGNSSNSSSYEPGSGSTIMAYAGICNSHNIQSNSDPYFHTRSFDQITTYVAQGNGFSCAEIQPVDNNEPEISILGGDGVYIPINTPFELIAEGSDVDGDTLTYCWEQFNLGPSGAPNSPTGNAPMFRSFSPTLSPVRTFPKLDDLLDNTISIGEVMPFYDRGLTFRCTVRDNNPEAGGVTYDQIGFNVTESAGPFEVTAPENETWILGETKQVEWNVAGTDQGLVNCDFVDVYLSLDGGQTWPVVIQESIPNNGSTSFAVPAYGTDSARIKVKCADNIFFAINPDRFTIESPNVSLEITSTEETICPNDQLTIPITLNSDAPVADINIDAITNTPGVALELSVNEFTAPANLELIVNTDANLSVSDFEIMIVADVENIGELEETINVAVVNGTNPSDVELLEPLYGTTNVGGTESFAWYPTEGATDYSFELATDFGFNNIIETAYDLSQTFYTSPTQLTSGTVYYWRIRAYAGCSLGSVSPTYAFQTGGGAVAGPQVTSSVVEVNQGGSALIHSGLLSINGDIPSSEITYYVTALPEAGTLFLDGTPVTVGSTFTQVEVNLGSLTYAHLWSAIQEEDQFTFDVSDMDGGWSPNQTLTFDIELNVGILTSNFKQQINVFPNPSDGTKLNFELPFIPEKAVNIELKNTAGQTIGQWTRSNQNQQLSIEPESFLASLASGIYFYQVQSGEFVDSGKLVIIK